MASNPATPLLSTTVAERVDWTVLSPSAFRDSTENCVFIHSRPDLRHSTSHSLSQPIPQRFEPDFQSDYFFLDSVPHHLVETVSVLSIPNPGISTIYRGNDGVHSVDELLDFPSFDSFLSNDSSRTSGSQSIVEIKPQHESRSSTQNEEERVGPFILGKVLGQGRHNFSDDQSNSISA